MPDSATSSSFTAALLGLLAATSLPQSLPAQVPYSPSPGIHFTVVPLDQPYLLVEHSIAYLGAGARLTERAELTLRAGRSRDVPPGNPLPVMYIGQTSVEARFGYLLGGPVGAPRWRLRLATQLTAQDSSDAVQHAHLQYVEFRGGRRVTEGSGRVEVARYWDFLDDSSIIHLDLVLGGLVEVHHLRSSPLLFDGGAVRGTMEGSTGFIPAAVASAPLSISLPGRALLVIEPTFRLIPIPSAYGFRTAGGVEVTLNL